MIANALSTTISAKKQRISNWIRMFSIQNLTSQNQKPLRHRVIPDILKLSPLPDDALDRLRKPRITDAIENYPSNRNLAEKRFPPSLMVEGVC